MNVLWVTLIETWYFHLKYESLNRTQNKRGKGHLHHKEEFAFKIWFFKILGPCGPLFGIYLLQVFLHQMITTRIDKSIVHFRILGWTGFHSGLVPNSKESQSLLFLGYSWLALFHIASKPCSTSWPAKLVVLICATNLFNEDHAFAVPFLSQRNYSGKILAMQGIELFCSTSLPIMDGFDQLNLAFHCWVYKQFAINKHSNIWNPF